MHVPSWEVTYPQGNDERIEEVGPGLEGLISNYGICSC
jgi:hypothetical protein